MFRINPEKKESEAVEEVEFSALGLRERDDIQEWIAANPSILSEDLLIISKEFSDFDRTKERLDLLAVDERGELVIIELKRDDSGVDVHWQAIKYASYLHEANARQIVGMLARHKGVSEEDARSALEKHLGMDNLAILNKRQRIILASHRFALEVTSAALWINAQVGRPLITCVQLTPYKDGDTNTLYLQANTLIPPPGTESYSIGIGPAQEDDDRGRSGFTRQDGGRQAEYDEVKHFFAKVEERAIGNLSEEFRPDRRIRYGRWRYTHIWYSREPWDNWKLCYRIAHDSSSKVTSVGLLYDSGRVSATERTQLKSMAERRVLGDGPGEETPWPNEPHYVYLATTCRVEFLNEGSVEIVANKFKHVIETMAPEIDKSIQGRSDRDTV